MTKANATGQAGEALLGRPAGAVLRGLLLCTALALAGLGPAGPAMAAGDSEVFDPGGDAPPPVTKPDTKTKKPDPGPAPADPIVGTWDITEKGTTICSGTGTLVISAKGGGYSGFMTWPLSEGPTTVSVRGNRVHIVYPWEDVLGGSVKTVYDGTLSADRLVASGGSTSEWYDACTFSMQHR